MLLRQFIISINLRNRHKKVSIKINVAIKISYPTLPDIELKWILFTYFVSFQSLTTDSPKLYIHFIVKIDYFDTNFEIIKKSAAENGHFLDYHLWRLFSIKKIAMLVLRIENSVKENVRNKSHPMLLIQSNLVKQKRKLQEFCFV